MDAGADAGVNADDRPEAEADADVRGCRTSRAGFLLIVLFLLRLVLPLAPTHRRRRRRSVAAVAGRAAAGSAPAGGRSRCGPGPGPGRTDEQHEAAVRRDAVAPAAPAAAAKPGCLEGRPTERLRARPIRR